MIRLSVFLFVVCAGLSVSAAQMDGSQLVGPVNTDAGLLTETQKSVPLVETYGADVGEYNSSIHQIPPYSLLPSHDDEMLHVRPTSRFYFDEPVDEPPVQQRGYVVLFAFLIAIVLILSIFTVFFRRNVRPRIRRR